MNKNIILKCTPLQFYTLHDEEIFFDWLKKIECIEKYKGIGHELHLYISSNEISDENLLDLIGLFKRYKFDGNQLKIFKNEQNQKLFD